MEPKGLMAPELAQVPESDPEGSFGMKRGDSGRERGESGRSSGDGEVDLKSGEVARRGLRGSGVPQLQGGDTSTDKDLEGVSGGRPSKLRKGLPSGDKTDGLPSGEMALMIGDTQRNIALPLLSATEGPLERLASLLPSSTDNSLGI